MTLRPNDYDRNGDIIPDSVREEKGDLISRSALIKEINENPELFESERVYLEGMVLNAPTVELTELCKGCQYLKDCETCEEKLRPQGGIE